MPRACGAAASTARFCMPAWLIDLFGSRQINHAFWWLTLAPLPVWIALVVYPHHAWTRRLASPFFVPPLLGLAYAVLLWRLIDFGAPPPPASAAARSTRLFLLHPLVFLVLWAHLQMANLFVAAVLLEDARRHKLRIPGELALCWLFAPLAVLAYTARRLVRRVLSPR